MYSAKCVFIGMLAGMVLGTSNLVQRHIKSMCQCSKNLLNNGKDKMQDLQKNINDIDFRTIKDSIYEKVEQFKLLLDDLIKSIKDENVKSKFNEVKLKVDDLFKDFKQSLSI